MRDDFTSSTKDRLARRVACRCSNPSCSKVTSGPQLAESGAVNIGVAAHITAAARGGPRYDEALLPLARQSIENGIWLCANCATLIDRDPGYHTVSMLRQWKSIAEERAALALHRTEGSGEQNIKLASIEKLMPQLFEEMRRDLVENPLMREIVLLSKKFSFWSDKNNPVLCYYFEDHADLTSAMRLLENNGLVREITYNNVRRFVLEEDLVSYLARG